MSECPLWGSIFLTASKQKIDMVAGSIVNLLLESADLWVETFIWCILCVSVLVTSKLGNGAKLLYITIEKHILEVFGAVLNRFYLYIHLKYL